jgi:hypothetical protein
MSPFDQLLYWSFWCGLLVAAGAVTLRAALSAEVSIGIKANVVAPLGAIHFQLANFDQA